MTVIRLLSDREPWWCAADRRSSFDGQLFYGRELCLVVFEVLFFAAMDLIVQNYVFDAAMLYLLMQVCLLSS